MADDNLEKRISPGDIYFCERHFVKLIASAKSRSVREASQQPALMIGCLTISHTCLPCLPRWEGGELREVSWERWEISVLGSSFCF